MNTLKHTWHHLRRSPFQSMLAILVTSVSFFILAVFLILSVGMSSVLQYFETKPEITLFLKDGLDRVAVENVQKDLSAYPNIKEVKFISKEKALSIYKEQNKDNPLLTEMVTASILPASFEVSVTDPKVLETIYQNFSTKKDLVSDIIYQKNFINNIINWTNNIRIFGIIAVITLTVISFFEIITIIGMKITNRKEEIKISRLLGASKFYVKKPFILEGIFYGISGAALGNILATIIALNLKTRLNTFFNPIIFIQPNISFYFLIFFSEILVGICIGYFSSTVGVKRHIKF